jgi:pimeloyl-ACP methyl ester carboxylesterase
MQSVFDQAWAVYNGRHDVMTIGGEAIMVHRAGAGRPLVCIHGWAMGGLSFAPQLALIDQGFEIIAPDLPGFGDSSVPGVPHTIATLANLVRRLITDLYLSEVILVGWSMGASVAWHLAATSSAELDALVSVDMSPRVAPEYGWDFALSTSMTPETIELAVQAMRDDWTGYCDLFLDRILADPNAEIRKALANLAGQADPVTASQAWLSLMQFDARVELAQIQVPALTIHGGRSVVYPQTVGHEIARLMPKCRAIVLDDVGHAPHLEAPDAFNAHLLALAKRPPRGPTLCQHITAQ